MIKVLVENHKENDRIKAEIERKRKYDLHTIVCEECNAKFHFYPENINVSGGRMGSLIKGANVKCPCCRHPNAIDISIAVNDNSLYIPENKRNKKMDILEEGNFHKEIECDNCESKFSFNYSDTSKKEFAGEGAYYYADVIKCPICGKELKVIK